MLKSNSPTIACYTTPGNPALILHRTDAEFN